MTGFDKWNPLRTFKPPKLSNFVERNDDDSTSESEGNVSVTSSILLLEEVEKELRRHAKPTRLRTPGTNTQAEQTRKGPRVHYGLDNVRTAAQPIWNMTDRFLKKDHEEATKTIKDTWKLRNITIPPPSPSKIKRVFSKPKVKSLIMISTRLFSPYYATPNDEILFEIEFTKSILKPTIDIHPQRKKNGHRVPHCIVSRMDNEGKKWQGNAPCQYMPVGPVKFICHYKSLGSIEFVTSYTTNEECVHIGKEEIYKPLTKTSVPLDLKKTTIQSIYNIKKEKSWIPKRKRINYLDKNKKWVLSLSQQKGVEFQDPESFSEPLFYKVMRHLKLDKRGSCYGTPKLEHPT